MTWVDAPNFAVWLAQRQSELKRDGDRALEPAVRRYLHAAEDAEYRAMLELPRKGTVHVSRPA